MIRDWSFSLAVILISFLLALILTGWMRRTLSRRAMFDIPNDRSSHKAPVPRGGGWAILIVLLPALIWAAYSVEDGLRYAGPILALLILAAISWADDKSHVDVRTRLSLHILAASLGAVALSPQETVFGGWLPLWLDRAIMIIGWAWFMNLYNFMDGIDGITGAETISIATGTCLVLTASGIDDSFVSFTTLILTGTCLGFLAYNWHPARIFLGDVGSVPLGYLLGFCLIMLAVEGHLASAIILPLYYLADSGITITHRALRGQKIWQAHREHFYQRAALAMGRHDQVVIWVTIANTCLIGAALWAVFSPWQGLFLGILIVAILLRKLHKTAL